MTQKVALFSLLSLGTVGASAGSAYYLSLDRTVRDKLNRENFQLASTNDEYEISFKEFKASQEYIDLIKDSSSTLKTSSSLQDGAKDLKKWCENNLNLKLTNGVEKTIKNIKKHCAKPPATIEEKIKGKRNLINNWTDKLGKLKAPSTDSSLLADLKKINKDLADLNANNAHSVLESWCKLKIKTELIKDKKDEVWKLIESRCLEPIA